MYLRKWLVISASTIVLVGTLAFVNELATILKNLTKLTLAISILVVIIIGELTIWTRAICGKGIQAAVDNYLLAASKKRQQAFLRAFIQEDVAKALRSCMKKKNTVCMIVDSFDSALPDSARKKRDEGFSMTVTRALSDTNLTRNTFGTPHPSPLPWWEREQETSLGAPAPLLPLWEKGLGDEGYPLLPLEILSRFKLLPNFRQQQFRYNVLFV